MIFECSASKEYMELILERISRKVAFSEKVGFSVPEAMLWRLVAGTVGTALQSFGVTPMDCQYKAYLWIALPSEGSPVLATQK